MATGNINKKDPAVQARINQLARMAIATDAESPGSRKELQELLGFDDLNLAYFLTLFQAKINPRKGAALQIFEEGKPAEGKLIAYPTAIAPPEMLKHLPWADYAVLARSPKNYAAAARRAVLWLKKMQAGTGSSMTRNSHKARALGIPEKDVRIGAKGTDLFIDAQGTKISLVEAQLLQSIYDAKKGVFGGIVLHDIISSETQASLQEVWKKPCLIDKTKTYQQVVDSTPGMSRFRESFQSYIPTLTQDLQITFNREAPGGHALFAVDSLRAAFIKALQPGRDGKVLVSSVGNGEDLSSTPDEVMVGWMVEEKVPIAMITTEKTPNDLKGGQIALVQEPGGRVTMTIIEKAQAEEAGQLALFEKLGLDVKREGQIAFFNTNMVLYNYDVLSPIVEKIIRDVGEAEFMRVIAPDLVDNWKEQTDGDGQKRKYLQLEGATASTLLNLDRWHRGRYGEPLVHIINVDKENRTRFFSPIKSAFDFFMQFHTDLFRLDLQTMRLIHQRPGVLPAVTLKHAASKDKYYQDVDGVLESFEGASILALDSLLVDGLVDARGTIFRGDVKIVNKSESRALIGKQTLENTSVSF